MDTAGMDGDVAVTISGVAPVTLIAQISVALIAVAVTAVYILKHLPDSGGNPGASRSIDRRVETTRSDGDRLQASEGGTQERNVNVADDADNGEGSISHESGEDTQLVPGPSSSTRGEYRAIISHEEYEDLCSNPPSEKPRSARKKAFPTGKSKEWPTSLESIDEEEEDEEDGKTIKGNPNRNGSALKHSPKRGSRVPSWYFSISSSGIPTVPKDRDLDAQFDQLATQSPVANQRPSKNITYTYENISYVDEARKKAITGFSGTPIGVVQRKPWPQDQVTMTNHGYSHSEPTSGQSQPVEYDHAQTARTSFALKGRVNSFENPLTRDFQKKVSIPDIEIHEPGTNDHSSASGLSNYEYSNSYLDEVDYGAVGGSSEWVETLASTVILPEKWQDELRAEVVQVTLDIEDEGATEKASRDDIPDTLGPRPISTYEDPQFPSLSESAPPLMQTIPSENSYEFMPIVDADQLPVEKRAPCTGAEQPPTNSNEGLHQQSKHEDLENKNRDAILQHGLNTRTGFIGRENIDIADYCPPSVTHFDGQDNANFTPDARVFTVVGCTPGPISTFHSKAQSSEPVSERDGSDSTPDNDIIVSHSERRSTPGADPVRKQQVVTSRSPYGTGTPSLSTGVSPDEGSLQKVEHAHVVTREREKPHIDHSREEQETTCVAVETKNTRNETLKTNREILPINVSEPKVDNAVGLVNAVNGSFPQNGNRENQDDDLDAIRAALTESLRFKRTSKLLINGSSKRQESEPTKHPEAPNNTGGPPSHEISDSELSSATSPSDVIAQQRARVRRSLEKLNVPDWYKKSNHYNHVLNSDQINHHDYQSDVEPRMTRSPSSCLSDCWSVSSSEEVFNRPPVSTKLAFHSEARYRRDFPKRLFHEPIRNAFSCAELPTQSSRWIEELTSGDTVYKTRVIDDSENSHGTDETNLLHVQPLNQTSLNDISSGSPQSQSSPSHGLRLRSRSEGDSLDQVTYFDSLAVKRLERDKSDSIFFVTGYNNDSADDLDYGQSDINSLFASGSLPDEPIDDMEYRRQMYEMKEYDLCDSVEAELQQRPMVTHNDLPNGNGYINRELEFDDKPSDYSLDNIDSPTAMVTMNTTTPDLYEVSRENRSITMETPLQWRPTPAPRRSLAKSSTMDENSAMTNQQTEELKPDPRYNPDGSKNLKLSPRFAMVTPQYDCTEASPRNSPSSTSPRRTAVTITVTDTSLEDEPSTSGHHGDKDQVSQSSSDQETVVDGTTNSWTPLDLAKLKESKFTAVLSVITSRHMKAGNRSGLYVPGSGFIPPSKEVTMEEIVDSLLGLPYQRAASTVDINSSGYRGSSSTSTPITCSTPDLSSSLSLSRGSTPISSSEKSHSADSLYSEDGNVLNAIIVGRIRNDEGSKSRDSYEECGSDVIGDEIILVKCSYKKCARTKELDEARKTFKTCHNCYTYYCSRQCRKLHWPRHKKRCLFSRVNSACKHVIHHSRYNGQLQSDLTRVARTGYLSRGRGAILLIFPDTEAAENYAERGFDALPSAPTYSTVCELENSDLFGDHMKFLLEMCRTYNPEMKFVLNVAIMASSEQHRGSRPRRSDTAVKKCAKLSLISSNADPSSTKPDPVPDTLIITSPSGTQRDGELDRKSRQVCFVHIQRQLRQRGVNLRHQHTEIYDGLCRWVEEHEHFTPTTIYPIDERTGERFMCVLMPEAEPDELGWINNPELLEDIDLDAELEKLENLAGMIVTDL